MRKLFTTALVSICVLGLAACSHAGQSLAPPLNGSNSHGYLTPQGVYGGIGPSASLQVLLGDAPPDLYGKVLAKLNLGIQEVDAIHDGHTSVLATFQKPLVVNVLNHADGNGRVVAKAEVDRTQYDQLRLVVDLATSEGVFRDGTKMPLNFQVDTQTSSTVGAGSTTTTTADGPAAVDIVVTQPFSIPEDGTNAVRMDFNAFESLDLWQNGGLIAVPALFVAPVDEGGSISGRVMNGRTGVQDAVVVAYAADGSIGNTVNTDSRGRFEMRTLNAGNFTLEIFNQYTNAAGRTFTSTSTSNVPSFAGPSASVEGGENTNVGTIQD